MRSYELPALGRSFSRRDLSDAPFFVKEAVLADAVAAEVDAEVGLARLRAIARGVGRELGGRVDALFAGRAADAEIGAVVLELLQLLPVTTARAVALVEP